MWLPKSLLQSQTSHIPFSEQRSQESKPNQLWRPVTTASNNVACSRISSYINKAGTKVGPRETISCRHSNIVKAKIKTNSTMGPQEKLNWGVSQIHGPWIKWGNTTTTRTFTAFQNLQSNCQSTNNRVSVEKFIPKYHQALYVYSKTQTGKVKSPVIGLQA